MENQIPTQDSFIENTTWKEKGFDYKRLRELEQLAGSPYYLFDMEKLRDNYRKIDNAFRSRYENFIIGYSYKTNYLPHLCKTLSDMGAYAEVVSRLEYDLAIKIGVDPENIIFNGPVKTKEDIHFALQNKSIINLDSFYEIEYVKEYARVNKDEEVYVGLRISFAIEGALQEGYEVSRFGFCLDNGSLEKAILELSEEKNIRIHSLHCHFSTRNRSVKTYQQITEHLCQVALNYIPDTIEYIDVGGGIYGELPRNFQITAPSFDDYAEAICGTMQKYFGTTSKKPTLILEPGIAIAANIFSFVVKVIETKRNGNEWFVVTDGSVHNLKPTMHKRNLPMTIFKKNSQQNFGEYHIVGYTCMEKDYLAHSVKGVQPERDDYILFENAGAYTIVFNPPFIMGRPAILAIDGNEVTVARRRETFEFFFHKDLYQFQNLGGTFE